MHSHETVKSMKVIDAIALCPIGVKYSHVFGKITFANVSKGTYIALSAKC